MDEIIDEVGKDYWEGYLNRNRQPHTEIWNNYMNNKVLNKYITFRRIYK